MNNPSPRGTRFVTAPFLALLLGWLLGCQAEPIPSATSDSHLWVSFVENERLPRQWDYRLEGDEVQAESLPHTDPFEERETREEQSAHNFVVEWNGPTVLSSILFGTRTSEFSVSAKNIIASSNGQYALLSNVDRQVGPLLEASSSTHSLPLATGVLYMLPARWNPSGNLIAVSATSTQRIQSPPTEIILIDAAEPQILRRIPLGGRAFVMDVAWSPDGSELALLTTVYRPDTGFSKWISDTVYGGSHGRPGTKDLVLEIHSSDGSDSRQILIEDDVADPSSQRVVWRRR